MKIAFNIDYIYPMNTGIGRYGLELMKALINLNVPIELWMTRYMRKFPPLSRELMNRTINYPWPRRITDYIWPLLKTKFRGVNWVHSANGMLLPDVPGLRQTCMIHDMGPFLYGHMKSESDTLMWKKRIPAAVKKAECILVNSESTGDDLLNFFPEARGKVFVTPLGIDHFKEGKTAASPAEHILAVGTVEPRKNYSVLIKAYAALNSRKELPPLVIAGKDGFRADEYKKLPDALGIGDRVHFTGYITDEKLLELYSGALCLVHTAFHEGFGFTVPEAFTWKLPVAASKEGGLGEFFGDCVWSLDPESPDSVAEAVWNAIDRGVTPEQELARRAAAEKLTWSNCAGLTLTALENASDM